MKKISKKFGETTLCCGNQLWENLNLTTKNFLKSNLLKFKVRSDLRLKLKNKNWNLNKIGVYNEKIDKEGKYLRVGLEGAYTQYLSGKNGLRLMQKIADGQWKPMTPNFEREPVQGYDLHTTIDIEIQDIVHHELLSQLEKFKADHGTMILMETNSGKIKGISNLGRTEKGKYFEKINYVQLQRDAKAKGPKGMSGTKLRGFATSNDLEGFKDSITQKAQPYAEEMFKKLQGILGVDAVGEALGEQKKETPDEYMKRTGKKPTKVKPGTGDAGKKAIAKFKKSLGKSDKIEKDLDAKDKAEKEKQDENLDEYKLFKGTDNNSIKEQDPNKLKVLDWIADRADGKEHFLSFAEQKAIHFGVILMIYFLF